MNNNTSVHKDAQIALNRQLSVFQWKLLSLSLNNNSSSEMTCYHYHYAIIKEV